MVERSSVQTCFETDLNVVLEVKIRQYFLQPKSFFESFTITREVVLYGYQSYLPSVSSVSNTSYSIA